MSLATPNLQAIQPYLNYNYAATIASGQTETGVIDTGGMNLVGIMFPATFTGTTVTFEMCNTSSGTFVPVVSTTSGTALSYTVAQAKYSAIDPTPFLGIKFLKIKSGSTEGTARALVLSLRGV